VTDTLQHLKAALADRYAIEREIGSGGMAVVYLARDLRLDRTVALKVLRPELAASLGVERFIREIEIAGKLNHPNILPLYDSGEADGLLYYAMPVADALSHAHAYGVIHRDIKPENIMFQSGHAVVSDFGIARAVTAAGGEKLTQTGVAVGTPVYMSPEQAAGVGTIDARSDVYALGCLLYEMLAGEAPFTGPTAQAIMARHAMDPVRSLRTVRDPISASERYVTTPWYGNVRLDNDAYFLALHYERLGTLYEERGDREKALLYYDRLVDLWQNADPALQPRVEDARRRMAELVAEPR
jgi:serine/threonine-protein kinase